MGRLTEYIFLVNNPHTKKERFFWIDCERFRQERAALLKQKVEPESIKKYTKKDIFS